MNVSLLLMGILMWSAPQAGPAAAVGSYRLVGEHDVASGLVLRTDGSFEFFLIAGALDEHSKGRWIPDGNNLRLETFPKPVQPVFRREKAMVSADAPLNVRVVWPNGQGIAGVDVRIGFDSGAPVEDHTQESGWSLSREEKRLPRWIELEVPMHQLRSQRFPISTDEANALTFVLTPNDLGLIDFDHTLLKLSSGKLLMHRSGEALTYIRESD